MSRQLVRQILALGMMTGFFGVTIAVTVWFPDKIEILIGAWIALIQMTIKEYFGDRDPDPPASGAPQVS